MSTAGLETLISQSLGADLSSSSNLRELMSLKEVDLIGPMES